MTRNKKTMPEGMAKRFDPEGETGDESNRREKMARMSGGLFGLEIVIEPLHRVHAGFFDRALGDLADRRERHAGFTRDGALRDTLFSEPGHHDLVKIDWVFHDVES